MTNEGLRNFLLAEMNDRHLIARQFAELVGVSHTTINRFTDERNDQVPSLELLLKLSEGTNTNFLALLEIVFPGTVDNGLSPSAKILAQRIEGLPNEVRAVVESIIRGAPKIRG